jgi:dihydroneopterin aldolase
MTLTAGYVSLRQVRFRAFHGVLPQERQVGADFLLDLKVGYPLAKAMLSDSVDDTLNYATLYDLMAREMRQPSKLLEHVAGRMAEAISQAFPQVTSIDLELTKLNPPLGADCVGASIEVHFIKD